MAAIERIGSLFPFPRRREETPASPERLLYDGAFNLYIAWNTIEPGVLDFDLRSGSPNPLELKIKKMSQAAALGRAYRNGIIENFRQLIDEVKKTDCRDPYEAHNLQFLSDELRASYWYNRRLRGLKRERDQISNISYIQKTTGIPNPELSPDPDSELGPLSQEVSGLAQGAKITDLTEEGLLVWKMANQIDPRAVQDQFRVMADTARRKFEDFLGRKISFPFQIRPDNQNVYWWAYACTDNGNFLIKLNFSEEGNKIWTFGKIEELAYHEYFHLLRMWNRKEAIRSGKLHQVFGLTVVHGPEPVIDEGLGQSITRWIPRVFDTLSPEGKFQVMNSILKSQVYREVHLMVNGVQELIPTQEDISRFVHKYIPWEPESEISRQVTWRTKDPEKQAYLFTYGEGVRRHLDYLGQLSPKGRKTFLSSLLERPYTADQQSLLVAGLLMYKENRVSSGKT